jgi:hypothetical protein
MIVDAPRRARAPLALAAATVAAIASLSASASFDLDPFDSAELALVAVTAGLGHPPSQPAHTMLGWIATRGPWSPLAALALLSIIPFALAAALALRPPLVRDRRDEDAPDSPPSPREGALVCVSLALALAGLGPLRSVGARVEVYALAACFAVAGALVVRERSQDRRALVVASVLWGLAGATNPVIAAQSAWAMLAPLIRARRIVAALALGAGAVATTFASYAYTLSARTREAQTLVWSAPRRASDLVSLVFARDFSANVRVGPLAFARNGASFAWDLVTSGVALLIVVGALGFARRDPRTRERDPWLGALVWATLVGVAMVASNVVYAGNNPDYGGYVLAPATLALSGVGGLLLGAPKLVRRVGAAALATIGVLLALASGRSARVTRALAERALDAAPARALMVLESDHLLFSTLYLQRVEGRRRDLVILNPGWASSSWAWTWVKAQDPSLVVDLAPGRGRERRLATALASRGPSRAVVAETPSTLALAGGGGLCPRAFLWSSREGCGAETRSTVETQRFLRALAQRARASEGARSLTIQWDRRLVLFTGATLGAASHSLACAGIAARTYAAALGQEPPSWVSRPCSSRASRVPGVDLFTVDDRALLERIERARNDLGPVADSNAQ